MKSILFVDSCIRGAQSRTLRLANAFLSAVMQKYPDCDLQTADLNQLGMAPLSRGTLDARNALTGQWDNPFFAAARQFMQAELVVFAAPFWEGTFPAAMHTYLEHVCVTGLTFGYNEEGQAVGQCKADRAVFFSTRGGIYSQGPNRADDHAQAFLGSILRMLGIAKLDTVTAEGLDIIGMDVEAIVRQAEQQARALAETF